MIYGFSMILDNSVYFYRNDEKMINWIGKKINSITVLVRLTDVFVHAWYMEKMELNWIPWLKTKPNVLVQVLVILQQNDSSYIFLCYQNTIIYLTLVKNWTIVSRKVFYLNSIPRLLNHTKNRIISENCFKSKSLNVFQWKWKCE